MTKRLAVASGLSVILATTGCRDPDPGQSSANETPVADGQIVLVRRSHEVGAFILRNQTVKPERTDYGWYYRSDGQGRLSPSDPAVSSAVVTNAAKITFATFAIEWSINRDGLGWVYFSKLPTEVRKQPDYEMCVTTATNLAAIDANDGRWKYRTRPQVNLRALIESQVK